VRVLLCALALLLGLAASRAPARAAWRPAHTVIVVLENRSFDQVIGSAEMPYLNELARAGALMTSAYFAQTPYTGDSPSGLPARPSQPNYFYLFSGDDQGVLPAWMSGVGNELVPAEWRPFTTPNLGAALIESGATYAGFSESLPYPHYDAPADPDPKEDLYRRKHNPTINWINVTHAEVEPAKRRFVLEPATNLGFSSTHDPVDGRDHRGFAVDEHGTAIGYDRLPTVSLVVPNEQNDAHSAPSSRCDDWLRRNVAPYADWAREHDGLLIVTYDEDGSTKAQKGDPYRTGIDRIATLFVGPRDHVLPGRYAETIDHLNVLATVLDRYAILDAFRRDFGAAHHEPDAGAELANLRPIRDVFGEGPPLPPLEAHAP
jgi:phosphatidylinositol-3-phosphatase